MPGRARSLILSVNISSTTAIPLLYGKSAARGALFQCLRPQQPEKTGGSGFVSWDPEKPRTYGLREEISWRKKSMVPVPLVGAVHAGDPMLAVENIEDTYPIPWI